MPPRYSIVIRGGTIADGNGGEPYIGDIAITDGVIAAVGKFDGQGAREIDAQNRLVTPGFVDVHTHYDGQVTWSNRVTPSSWNGVTTVMMGNCGVGFAPCRPEQRDMLVHLMEGVEDIPEIVLNKGLPWNWQSFPDFLDALDARRYDMDIATQLPHAALRVFVMGQRGADREPANAEDRAEMARLATEAIRAGAFGFSTSRTLNHRAVDGTPTPTVTAAEEELTAIAEGMDKAGSGWIQLISDFNDVDAEFDMFRRLVQRSHRPLSLLLLQKDKRPNGWRDLLDKITTANDQGLPISAQVSTRATGTMVGLELSRSLISGRPSYEAVAHLPLEQRVAELRRPEVKARILAEESNDNWLQLLDVFDWTKLYPLGDPPDYEPKPEDSVAARAKREGRDPAEYAYDLQLERGGHAILYRPASNYAEGNLAAVRDMLQHPHTVVGLGDGGAHVGFLCDASVVSFMLTHWTRDRRHGTPFPIGWAVQRITRDPAVAIGLMDRGVIAPGYKADINVIDYDSMRLHPPEVAYDLPAGGRRVVQRTDGFVETLVSGVTVARNGEATGDLPGRLIRGPQRSPAA